MNIIITIFLGSKMTNSLKCKLDLPSFLKLRMVFGTCNNFLFIYFGESFNIADKVSKVIVMTIWVSLDHGERFLRDFYEKHIDWKSKNV